MHRGGPGSRGPPCAKAQGAINITRWRDLCDDMLVTTGSVLHAGSNVLGSRAWETAVGPCLSPAAEQVVYRVIDYREGRPSGLERFVGQTYLLAELPNEIAALLPRAVLGHWSARHEYACGRWDAAHADYRTMYAAASKGAAFVEILKDFRFLSLFEARVRAATDGAAPEADDDDRYSGRVAVSRLDRMVIVEAVILGGQLVDVMHSDTHMWLNRARLRHPEIARALPGLADCAAMMDPDRWKTRPVAGVLRDGTSAIGIRSRSRFALEDPVFALWERGANDDGQSARLRITGIHYVTKDDPDALHAMRRLDIESDPLQTLPKHGCSV